MTPAEHYNAGITTLLEVVSFWCEGSSHEEASIGIESVETPPFNAGKPSSHFRDGFEDARDLVLENFSRLDVPDPSTVAAGLVAALRVEEED